MKKQKDINVNPATNHSVLNLLLRGMFHQYMFKRRFKQFASKQGLENHFFDCHAK